MRAIRTLRVPAISLAAGALAVTLTPVAAVIGTGSGAARAAQEGSSTPPNAPAAEASTLPAAPEQPAVLPSLTSGLADSRFVIDHRAITGPVGSPEVVHGVLLPGERRAKVRLLARTGRHWYTLAVGRTRGDGRFAIRYRLPAAGITQVRVSFGGSAVARAASAGAGEIVPLQPTVASWYYDAGGTACGFHATYGVANRTLPCGTKVTLWYGGRSVVATVDDRGPYVYGRSFDLNQNTARYLGMWGVGRVFASV